MKDNLNMQDSMTIFVSRRVNENSYILNLGII